MAKISGLVIDGYTLVVEYNGGLEIEAVYIGHSGGVNVWPILCDSIRLKIFDQVFKNT